MQDRPLNHFGNECHGDFPNLFNAGHPLDYDLLEQVYGEDGDGTDLGLHADPEARFVPIDEISEEDLQSGFVTESDDWMDDFFPPFESTDQDNLVDNDQEMGREVEIEVPEKYECDCISQCGCNHRNRNLKFLKKRLGLHGRRGRHDHRRLARNRRQSIRKMTDNQLIHIL